MNQVIVSGNLGEDPQSAVTPTGRAVARFSICSKMKYTDTNGEQKEIPEWHRCIAWGKIADDVSTFLSKGDYIMILGREQSRSYTDKNNIKRTITEINIQSIWMPLMYFREKKNQKAVQPSPNFQDMGKETHEEEIPL
ncbi:single-stranded DNA-binding protein [uncultured Megasphaera sp.]|uniref:single-stranded DNA-binding protein n=1 Tax=uncultured Megasphaera sp. TaxID=165188 RepID=UPI0026003466|nr:single-stranded DNA-binding protein [uncultured Megasphaera sp.]